ncbi:MAG TPA: carboxypeptidase-like regulatory domain-containing protein, partial [Anaerolineae bacterium]|nr:carboxypeptidase-like regulatory domain-containing protein [Anaerolineae bacterium]
LEPGKASVGGDVRVLVGGFPQTLQGVDVWAYSPGGGVYHTITIQDGTYHFYNIPPGTYTIYAEIWVGGGLRFATTTVTLGAGPNEGVNLFLL